MKKITLLFCFSLVCGFSFSQTEVWSDNFDDEDISDWTLTDADGDTNIWGDTFTVGPADGPPITPVSLISRSWSGVALTPDNWAVSPAINLSGASGTITVEWVAQVAAQAWDEEKYSIHVGTSSDISVLISSTLSITETLGDAGNTGTPTPKSLDISSLDGEATVYIAFRHWDCTDQDFISFDDLVVKAETLLSVDEFNINQFTYRYNKRFKTLNLESSNRGITGVEIYSILGQSVLSKSLSDNSESIDVSSLNDGVYLVKVNMDGNFKTIKFVKN